MARGLKFRIKIEEGLYYPCSENKGADQLRGYREADLRLCFRICKTLGFSWCGSFILVKRYGRWLSTLWEKWMTTLWRWWNDTGQSGPASWPLSRYTSLFLSLFEQIFHYFMFLFLSFKNTSFKVKKYKKTSRATSALDTSVCWKVSYSWRQRHLQN